MQTQQAAVEANKSPKAPVDAPKPLSASDVVRAAQGGNNAFQYYVQHGKLPVAK